MNRLQRSIIGIIFLTAISILCGTLVAGAGDGNPRTIRFSISFDEPTMVDRILYNAFQRMGYETTFEATGMANAIQIANSGEKDGLYAQTPGLEKNFPGLVMVPEQVCEVKFEAYALKSRALRINSWEDLGGFRVGTLFQKHYIHNHLPEDIADLVQKETVPILIQALLDGECDVIVMTNSLETDVIVPEALEKAGLADRVPAYPYLNRKYEHLIPFLIRTLREMKADGTFERIAHQERIEDGSGKTVLHVSSYYADMKWEKELAAGLEEALGGEANIQIYTVYLNSNRVLDDDSRAKSIFTTLRGNILKKIPDVVVLSNKNAMTFMLDYYSRLFTDVPVVFCGMEDFDPGLFWKMEGNVTGTTETPAAYETVEQMLKMFPATKHIFVVNDRRETGSFWKRIIDRQLAPLKGRVTVTHNDDLPFSQLLETIRNLPADTLILCGFYYVDGNGIAWTEEYINRRIAEVAAVPVFGLADTTLGYGQVGGKYTDARLQGKAAAEMALAVMNGTPARSIEIRNGGTAANQWLFDYGVLQKWGISSNVLPDNAVIINRPPSMRETDPAAYYLMVSLIAITLVIIFGLSVFMIILRKQNRKLLETQKYLHTAEELLEKDVEIREVKNRLEKTIESAPLAYMLLIENRIVETNSYLKENLDIESEANIFRNAQDPDPLAELRRQLLRDGVVYGVIQKFKMKNGETHRFHINLASVEVEGRQALVFWGIDIEESERRRDFLAGKQEELQKLVDAIPIPIFICAPETWKIMYANRFFLDMFGFETREETLGITMRVFHPRTQPNGEETDPLVRRYADRILSKESPGFLGLRYERPDGQEIYAQVTGSFVVYDNSDSLLVAVRDMGAERKREELLLEAAEREREANQLKSVFLMNMSHEIRTPMNAIMGFSQLALHTEQTPTNADLFKKINVSAKNLLNILNDILDFSKIEAKKLDLVAGEFDLEEIVANAFTVASERLENKKIEMLVDIDPDVPCTLVGDRIRVWQVLKNLLDNSAKYTEEGHVVLKVSARPSGENDRNFLFRFVVEDTGLGMSESQLARLFRPFEQFHNNAKTGRTGTGLGMSITRQLVELMGGSIDVESRLEEGTRVTISLPLPKAEHGMTMKEHIGIDSLDIRKVLIADDDEYARNIMENLLKSVGVSAVCATSGREVFEKVREYEKRKTPFEIIIIDYLLGEDNGIEVARELRKITSGHSKLLMVSAYSRQLLAHDIEEAGFKGVIEKPFVPSAFIRRLCSVMEVRMKTEAKQKYLQFPQAKVLLCEDNVFNQDVARGMLGIFGIDPVVAADGREALEKLEHEDFHLVFMDIMMPVMDGHEATLAIRTGDRPWKNIPVVAMTANVMQDEITRCLREGMSGHIGKPMEIDQLYDCLLLHLPHEITAGAGSVPAEAPATRGLSAIEGMDTAAGIARFGGNEKKYREALLRFAGTLGDDLPPFPGAFADENEERTRRAIHTLKGVSGNLGIDRLFRETAEFERKLMEGTQTDRDYERLIDTCRVMKERIGSLREEEDARPEKRKTGTLAELKEQVFRAGEAFEASQLDACDTLVREVSEIEWQIGDGLLKAVFKALDEYDFEEALRLLDREGIA